MLAQVALNLQAEQLKRRTKTFALDVLTLVRLLPTTDEARMLGSQLSRAATGVAANYRATCRSRSPAEFVARIGVALEEADEAALWLEIIDEGQVLSTARTRELRDEADQLSAIFAQSRITASARLNRSRA